MADYGLIIKNASGNLVIDGTYANIALVEKMTLTATGSTSGPNGGSYKRQITISGYTSPVLVIYSPNCYVAYTGSKNTAAGSWTFTFHVELASTSFEVYFFDIASRGQRFSMNYGLQVKNKTTQEVVFDSRCKYMRILDIYSGVTQYEGVDMPAVTRSYSKAKVGVTQGTMLVQSINQILGGTGAANDPYHLVLIQFSAMKSSGGNVNLGMLNYSTSGPAELSQNPAVEWYQRGYMYLMVDLSNFD